MIRRYFVLPRDRRNRGRRFLAASRNPQPAGVRRAVSTYYNTGVVDSAQVRPPTEDPL